MFIYKAIAITKYAKQFMKMHICAPELSMPENMICMYLYFHKDINQNAVCGALGIDKGSVAKTVVRLEDEGFILREVNPRNRRENILRLTPKAEEIIKKAVKIAEDWTEKVLSKIDKNEVEIFNKVLNQILEAAGEN